MQDITTLGIDLAKNVFQLHGTDRDGKVVLQRRLTRHKFAAAIAQLPACRIGMEACGSANYWARLFTEMGHDVKIIPAQYVKPYVKTNKNDRNDAAAIHEALTRPHMSFVAIKSIEQQDLQSLNRVRRGLINERTQKTNRLRGLLMEYGIIIAQGIAAIRGKLPEIIEDADNQLTMIMREILQDSYENLLKLEERIRSYDKILKQSARTHPDVQRLMPIPGFAEVVATQYVASVGNGSTFRRGRDVSAWIGLVPKQSSSGNTQRLLGISKRGDRELRSLLIHGARAVLKNAGKKSDGLSLWLQKLLQRKSFNVVAVALANKLARVAWAVLNSGEAFREEMLYTAKDRRCPQGTQA